MLTGQITHAAFLYNFDWITKDMRNFDLFAGPRKQICSAFRGLSELQYIIDNVSSQLVLPVAGTSKADVGTKRQNSRGFCQRSNRSVAGVPILPSMFLKLRAGFDMVNSADENILDA